MINRLEDRVFKGPQAIGHPVRITTISGVLVLPALCCLMSESTAPLAPFILGLSYIGDALDGPVARKYGNKTKQGAVLDPYMDKFRNMFVGGYILASKALTNPVLGASVIANFYVDYISQKRRGDLLEQAKDCITYTIDSSKCDIDTENISKLRANNLGKIKTVIQSIVNLSYVTKEVFFLDFLQNVDVSLFDNADKAINYVFAVALGTSAYLGYKGIKRRMS